MRRIETAIADMTQPMDSPRLTPEETPIEAVGRVLQRLDARLRTAIAAAERMYGTDAAADPYRGLQITRAEVDRLLAQPAGTASLYAGGLWTPADAAAGSASWPRLQRLKQLFDLSPFDIDALLITLAPELDLRFERLFAYLQDDVTKKRPAIDLVLNLLCEDLAAKLRARERFAASAPLIARGLLNVTEDPSQPHAPLLGKYLKLDERVVRYLLGSDQIDDRASGYVELLVPRVRLADLFLPADLSDRLRRLVRRHRRPCEPVILYLQSSYGCGKRTVAEAVSGELGRRLLIVRLARPLQLDAPGFDLALRLASREAALQEADLYFDGFDGLLSDDRRLWLSTFAASLAGHGMVFLGGDVAWEPVDAFHDAAFVRVELAGPTYVERVQLWGAALANGATAADVDVPALANTFRFSGGQIRDAAATARALARWRDAEEGRITMADLNRACRLQSSRKLGTVARKITPQYRWDDIILPPDRILQLREICSYVQHRARVYDEWGFDRRLSLGKGLNILFAGPSGTGKTMAAEVVAGELQLDLYKIDLSTVVSKYIGETEKNLARIFAEAATSNAILFFDEADALFGKRTEVRDSHDRYANIEINYLLQKMEEHEGVVILATNFRKNMDDAFVRRLHVMIDFPFPNAADRHRIWERTWPADAPRSADVDWGVMSRRFEIAGGNIRNVALSAAFLAASDGGVVHMSHLLHGTRREYQKMGKVVVTGELERE